jgi:hypothetical protein
VNTTLESPIERLRHAKPAILDHIELFLSVDEQEAYLRELPLRSTHEHRRPTRRARKPYVLFAAVFTILAVAISLVVLPQTTGPNRSNGLAKVGHPQSVHVHLSGGALTIPGFLVPTYLPPGATQVPYDPAIFYQEQIATYSGMLSDPSLSPSNRRIDQSILSRLVSEDPYTHSAFFDYALPGAANKLPIVDPSFAIQIEETTQPQGPDNNMGGFLKFSPIVVNGVRGQLSMPSSGFGYYSISWTVGKTNYSVTIARFNTQYGPSGLSVEQALVVADGMKPPSGPVVSS